MWSVGLILLLWASVASAQGAIDLFLIAGQSNMDGRAEIADSPSPPDWSIPQSDILFFHDANIGWGDLDVGSSSPPGTLTTYGPELSFGRSLFDNARSPEIALMKWTKGSTSLGLDWVEGGFANTKFFEHYTASITLIEALGYTPTVRGMIWLQGESDAKIEAYADAYESNLTTFIAQARVKVNTPSMPFVIARIYVPSEATYPYRSTVRAAQLNVANADGRVTIFSTDDLVLTDGTHYDADSVIEIGHRFAEKMISLVYAVPGDTRFIPYSP